MATTVRFAQIAPATTPIKPYDTLIGVQGGTADVQYQASAVIGSDTLGMSNLGNTAGISGVVSGSALQLLLAGGDNITLSQSINGASVTLTISGAAGAVVLTDITAYAAANTTLSTSGTIALSNVIFAAEGAASVGVSNGSVVISAPLQSNQNLALYAAGNSTLSSSGTANATNLTLEAAGIASIGISNGSIVISATAPAQSAQTGNIFASSNTFGTSSGTYDARTLSIAGSGAIEVAASNSGWVISAPVQSNQQISGYAVSNTTLQTSGTLNASNLSFEGAGGVSVGISNGSVIISGGAGGGGDTALTAYAVSNTTLSTSGTIPLANVSFEGAGIASVGISNGSIIISASSAAQTNQTIGLYAESNTTLSTSATVDARSLSIEGAGIVSVGASNGSIVVSASSAAQTNQTLGLYAESNTTLSTSATVDARSLSFEGAGAISVGASNGSVVISGPAQTNQQLSMYGVGNTTLSTSSTGNASALSFEGEGLVSVGISAGSVVISATSAAQTNQSGHVYASSNTFSSTVGTYDGRTLSIAGSGAVSVAATNAGWIISAPVQSNQQLSLYAVSNTTLSTSSTGNASALSFEGAGNVSVGISNGSIVISANVQTNQTGNIYASSNTTGSTSGTYDARTLSMAGAGAISVEASNSGWIVSSPVETFLIAGNQISLSSNVNSITISFIPGGNLYASGNTFGTSSGTYDGRTLSLAGSGGISVAASNSGFVISSPMHATASQLEPLQFGNNSSGSSLGQSSLYFQHIEVPDNLRVCRLDRLVSFSMNNSLTATDNVTGTRSNVWNYNETIGLYSRGTGASSTNLYSVMSNSWSLGATESVSIITTVATSRVGISASYTFGFIANIDTNGGTTSGTFNSNTNLTTAAASTTIANPISNITGLAVLNVPFGSTLLSAGDYWLAIVGATALTTAGTASTIVSMSNIVLTGDNVGLKAVGQTATASSITLVLGNGAMNSQTAGFISSIGIPAISNNSNVSLYFNLMNASS